MCFLHFSQTCPLCGHPLSPLWTCLYTRSSVTTEVATESSRKPPPDIATNQSLRHTMLIWRGKRRQTETKHKLFFKVIFCQVSLINKRIIYALLRLASFIEEIDNNVNKEVLPIYIYTFCSLVTLPVHKPFTFPLECSEFYVVIHHVTRCKPKDHVNIVVVFNVINQYSIKLGDHGK